MTLSGPSLQSKSYFFCGIGGSGMLPLALILKGQGAEVSGSDRARDQGMSAEKFAYLEGQGFKLYPQDGSGPSGADQALVALKENITKASAAHTAAEKAAVAAETKAKAALTAATTATNGIPEDEGFGPVATTETKAVNLAVPDGIVPFFRGKLLNVSVGEFHSFSFAGHRVFLVSVVGTNRGQTPMTRLAIQRQPKQWKIR